MLLAAYYYHYYYLIFHQYILFYFIYRACFLALPCTNKIRRYVDTSREYWKEGAAEVAISGTLPCLDPAAPVAPSIQLFYFPPLQSAISDPEYHLPTLRGLTGARTNCSLSAGHYVAELSFCKPHVPCTRPMRNTRTRPGKRESLPILFSSLIVPRM